MQEMASRRFYLRLQIQYVYKYKLLGMKESKHWALQTQLRSQKNREGGVWGWPMNRPKDKKLAAKGLSHDQIFPGFQELTGVRQIQNFLRPRER